MWMRCTSDSLMGLLQGLKDMQLLENMGPKNYNEFVSKATKARFEGIDLDAARTASRLLGTDAKIEAEELRISKLSEDSQKTEQSIKVHLLASKAKLDAAESAVDSVDGILKDSLPNGTSDEDVALFISTAKENDAL